MMRPQARRYYVGLFTCVAMALVMLGPTGAAWGATPEQIQAAIDKGKAYLFAHEQNGNWEQVQRPDPPDLKAGFATKGLQWGGLTSGVVCAMLESGEDSTDKDLQPAIQFLLDAQLTGVYAAGLHAQVMRMLPQSPKVRAAIQRDGALLFGAMRKTGPGAGLFDYAAIIPEPAYDHSVSQFGVLGFWACEESGVEIPERYWVINDAQWRAHQYADGSWSYQFNDPAKPLNGAQYQPTAAMTAAGVATLYVDQEFLQSPEARLPGLESIAGGTKWMSDHFDKVFGPGIGGAETTYYTLYALGRMGVASGEKYLGTHDWYAEGADYAVKHQNADGSWGDPGGINGTNFENVPDTFLALLFLAQGSDPIAMSKLAYDRVPNAAPAQVMKEAWNHRPRDAANVCRWLGPQIERRLRWEVADWGMSDFDLHAAPILYLSGDSQIVIDKENKARLRRFVDDGGMILGNAEKGSEGFSNSFIKLGQSLFPNYDFRELPADHPIFKRQVFLSKKWGDRPIVEGLSNGVRELMVLIPTLDPARTWALPLTRNSTAMMQNQLLGDIYLYAVDEQVDHTPATYLASADPAAKALRTVRVARLKVGSNWDPEPGGWPRLAALMLNTDGIDVQVQAMDPTDPALLQCNIASLTGTAEFKLTDAQREALRRFIDGGGTLVVDAAGGAGTFADSAQSELEAIFGPESSQLTRPLPSADALYQGVPVSYRRYARTVLGVAKSPQLHAIQSHGHFKVVFSRLDLSAGLVGEQVDGIVGYSPETATALMRSLVLASVNQKK